MVASSWVKFTFCREFRVNRDAQSFCHCWSMCSFGEDSLICSQDEGSNSQKLRSAPSQRWCPSSSWDRALWTAASSSFCQRVDDVWFCTMNCWHLRTGMYIYIILYNYICIYIYDLLYYIILYYVMLYYIILYYILYYIILYHIIYIILYIIHIIYIS